MHDHEQSGNLALSSSDFSALEERIARTVETCQARAPGPRCRRAACRVSMPNSASRLSVVKSPAGRGTCPERRTRPGSPARRAPALATRRTRSVRSVDGQEIPPNAPGYTTVSIYDQTYHLSGQDPDTSAQLAEQVDGKMRAVAAHGRTVDSLRVAVLAALNLADELSQDRRRRCHMRGHARAAISRTSRRSARRRAQDRLVIRSERLSTILPMHQCLA